MGLWRRFASTTQNPNARRSGIASTMPRTGSPDHVQDAQAMAKATHPARGRNIRSGTLLISNRHRTASVRGSLRCDYQRPPVNPTNISQRRRGPTCEALPTNTEHHTFK
jgi:hypothetical protein